MSHLVFCSIFYIAGFIGCMLGLLALRLERHNVRNS